MRGGRSILLPAALIVVGLSTSLASPPAGEPGQVELDAEASCRLQDGHTILFLARPRTGDTWKTLAARYGAPGVEAEDLAAIPPSGNIRSGIPVVVPYGLLSEPWKAVCVRALFPRDSIEGDFWVHRPSLSPVETYGEGVWQAAEWLTGDGANFRQVTRARETLDPLILPGEEVRLPVALVRPALRAGAGDLSAARGAVAAPAGEDEEDSDIEPAEEEEPAAPTAAAPPEEEEQAPPSPAPAPGAKGGPLRYGADAHGRYALYRLKPGEALYSAVVIRFTGRVDPDEVSAAARTIAQANGISDVRSIPAGFSVRIPLDLLLPEFRPPGDPERARQEAAEAEAERFRNPARARNLEGVHLILDAGHGGVDRGATRNGVAEHEYVYDVLCRLKRLIEKDTAARVHLTILDRRTGDRPRDARVLPVNSSEQILTTPPHENSDPSRTRLGVNLRWYLANSIYRRLVDAGTRPERIVFLSLHADSLHPSLRGGMIYIPGEQYRRGEFTIAGASSSRYREVREQPEVTVTRAEALRSEGLSRELARRILAAMGGRGLAVHPYMPVRERIIRGGRAWVPAVLRANQVPVKILVEIANLNNTADARLVTDPAFRERTARALLDGLLEYYAPARPVIRPVSSPPSRKPSVPAAPAPPATAPAAASSSPAS